MVEVDPFTGCTIRSIGGGSLTAPVDGEVTARGDVIVAEGDYACVTLISAADSSAKVIDCPRSVGIDVSVTAGGEQCIYVASCHTYLPTMLVTSQVS